MHKIIKQSVKKSIITLLGLHLALLLFAFPVKELNKQFTLVCPAQKVSTTQNQSFNYINQITHEASENYLSEEDDDIEWDVLSSISTNYNKSSGGTIYIPKRKKLSYSVPLYIQYHSWKFHMSILD
ncbi:MAG: hypothetical protein EAZ13_03860 [Sphingobacteriia bacterium]|nr:MAG: hypothetical protein EAZ13_03860 [Sphingobacteriia bacterium]